MSVIENAEKIGIGTRDLCLQTRNKVYVKVKDRLYTLKFKDQDFEDLTDSSKSSNSTKLLVLDSEYDLNELTYPGENVVIFTLDGHMYITRNNLYNEFSSGTNGDSNSTGLTTLEGPVAITGSPALIINSSTLISNLNADLLDGYHASDFIRNGTAVSLNNLSINNIYNAVGGLMYDGDTKTLYANKLVCDKIESSDGDDSVDYISKRTIFSNSAIISSVDLIDGCERSSFNVEDKIEDLLESGMLSEEENWLDVLTTTEVIGDDEDDYEVIYHLKDRNTFASYGLEDIYDSWKKTEELNNSQEYGSQYLLELNVIAPFNVGENVVIGDKMEVIVSEIKLSEPQLFVLVKDTNCECLAETIEDFDYDACKEERVEPEVGDSVSSTGGENVIGNLQGITNSVFGKMSGSGISAENNCYFINPGIALTNNEDTFLKLHKTQSYLGNKNNCQITIDENGNLKVMYSTQEGGWSDLLEDFRALQKRVKELESNTENNLS